ncbi:aldolase [Cytobacillus suaedae]|nr:aldolase [Cytobacillus suaedae]
MRELLQKFRYKTFGLVVESDFFMPELIEPEISVDYLDVSIVHGELENVWKTNGNDSNVVVKPNYVLFKVPNTAIFLIEDGERVIVSPFKGSDENKIRLYILGTCMGTILMQKKILPLHGSAVSIYGKAYAIVGNSGAGKSTLASTFISNGYSFLSDDVIAVSLSNEKGIPYVLPSYPQQKLWEQSLTALGMDNKDFKPLFERENKFAVPVENGFSLKPVPLAGVFELTITNTDKPKLVQLSKLEQLHKLYRHTYRQFLIPKQSLTDWHFKASSLLSSHINFCKLERPEIGFSVNQLMDMIIETIRSGE